MLHLTSYTRLLGTIKTGLGTRPILPQKLIPKASTMSTATEFKLFPAPSAPESKYVPSWTGFNPESTATLTKVLEDNHKRWHIFFNDKGFHNHAAHRALAIWSLGADADVIQAGYDADCDYQLPAIEPPEKITAANFNDHLGKRNYYGAYLAFFTDVIKEKGTTAAIEEYIFSKKANLEPAGSNKPHPGMLGRFFGGLLHPMIHTGYGFEFGLPGMAAEGLAEAAVHPREGPNVGLIPASFFETTAPSALSQVVSRLKSIGLSEDTSPGVHAFTVLARALKDPELGTIVNTEDGMFAKTMNDHSDALARYVKDWHVDGSNPQGILHKMEELMWTNALIYGVGGWHSGKDFNADFFHMHMVTSSAFLGSLMAHLSPASQELLLKGYFLVCLGWWVSRGRAEFDIEGFFKETTIHPPPSGSLPTPEDSALPSSSSSKAVTPNPWLPIIETSLVHPDDHLTKIQRTLRHYSSLFGTRPAGLPDFKNTELAGADKIDGSLFIRAAGLTAKRLGRVREGEHPGKWDRNGFYKV